VKITTFGPSTASGNTISSTSGVIGGGIASIAFIPVAATAVGSTVSGDTSGSTVGSIFGENLQAVEQNANGIEPSLEGAEWDIINGSECPGVNYFAPIGTLSAVGSTSLTATGTPWAPNAYVGQDVIVGGSNAVVTANTNNTMTFSGGWNNGTPSIAIYTSIYTTTTHNCNYTASFLPATNYLTAQPPFSQGLDMVNQYWTSDIAYNLRGSWMVGYECSEATFACFMAGGSTDLGAGGISTVPWGVFMAPNGLATSSVPQPSSKLGFGSSTWSGAAVESDWSLFSDTSADFEISGAASVILPTSGLEVGSDETPGAAQVGFGTNGSTLLLRGGASITAASIYLGGTVYFQVYNTGEVNGGGYFANADIGPGGVGAAQAEYSTNGTDMIFRGGSDITLAGFYSSDGTADLPVYGGTYHPASDRRLKKDIRPTQYGLDTILSLKPVDFTYRKTGERTSGFIAQDVQKIMPDLVSSATKGGMLSLDYDGIEAPLVRAIQEQQAEINSLESELAVKSPNYRPRNLWDRLRWLFTGS
jgi:hypothetical protein